MNNRASNARRISILQRTATEVRNHRVLVKLLSLLLTFLIFFVGAVYVVSILYKRSGTLTISLDKYEMTRYGLSLSESRELTHMTSHLNAKIVEKMTNISDKSIADNVDMIDGEHNGRDYIAYTFYLEHRGTDVMDYEYEVTIGNVSLGLDDAMRVRLYIGDEGVEYAKLSAENTPEPYSTPFHSTGVITRGLVEDFAPGDKVKYTIVIWLEGDDPECVDRVIDGMAKVEMNFKAVPKAE